MRLADYPYVIVRVACGKCQRRGQYRLARLAERYGANITLPYLLEHLAGDCKRRDLKTHVYDYCGAYFPDAGSPRPPDRPPAAAAAPKLRVVR